jgi:TolB protein
MTAWLAAFAITLIAVVSIGAPAHAAFPGTPGWIAYSKVKHDEATGTSGGLLAHSPFRLGRNFRLTSNPNDSAPAFSPNGRQIVFARRATFPELGTHIYLANADGSGLAPLTAGVEIDSNPSFSRDGRQIVFDRRPAIGGPSHIFIVNVDGSGLRQLTSGAGNDGDPTFTPNGRRIVFTGNRDPDSSTDRSDIFSMKASGTDLRVLVDGPRIETEPDVSPNGRRVAFVSNRSNGPNIFVARMNGTRVRQLTHTPGRFSDIDYLHPSWAPDGKHIALLSETRYLSDLEVMRSDGTQRKSFEGAGHEAEGFGTYIGPPSWGNLGKELRGAGAGR